MVHTYWLPRSHLASGPVDPYGGDPRQYSPRNGLHVLLLVPGNRACLNLSRGQLNDSHYVAYLN